MGIKQKLKENKLVMFTYRAYQAYKAKETNVASLTIRKYENPYYLIKSGNLVSGFFAEYRRLIDALAYAQLYNFKPYVLYNKEYLYSEEDGFMGTNNPYEYYFEQLYPEFDEETDNYMKYKEADRDYIYIGINKGAGNYNIKGADLEMYIDRSADIVKKYIHYNAETTQYLESNICQLLMNKKTLGVHARGGEWRIMTIKNHPNAIPLEEHIKQAQEIMAEYGFEQIFLASDENDAITSFKEAFGDKVVFYQDTVRGESGECLAFSTNERKHHKYKMGMEVLRDAETLVHCQGLIAGLSNISTYVQIKKKVFGERFEILLIDNKGINTGGLEAKEAQVKLTDKNIYSKGLKRAVIHKNE